MATKTVQYPFAYDENNNLVFIKCVVRDHSEEHTYHCPNCGGAMRPRQGEHNVWHFAHDNHKCGVESYIHKIAKRILVNRFNAPEAPFKVGLNIKQSCYKLDLCDIEKSATCQGAEHYVEYDLTQFYRGCAFEETRVRDFSSDDVFIPDVLLKDKHGKRKDIYLEVYYKHKCNKEKVASGTRIIEVHVRKVEDLQKLETQTLFVENKDVKFFNFSSPPTTPEKIEATVRDEAKKRGSRFVDQSYLPACKQSITYRRSNLRWQRIVYMNNGKTFVNGIFDHEKEHHYDNAILDITYDSTKIKDPQHINALAAFHVPKFRTCYYCDFCVHTENISFCKARKNGTTRKGTFDKQKGSHCLDFKWSDWLHFLEWQIQETYSEGEDYQIWISPRYKSAL